MWSGISLSWVRATESGRSVGIKVQLSTEPMPSPSAVSGSSSPERARRILFERAGSSFGAYCGHKEAISKLPAHAVTLAYSERCPVQAFRIGRRVYATQFHPELDLDGLATRIEVYKYAGYFKPEQADAVLAAARASGVTEVPNILEGFVELFAQQR